MESRKHDLEAARERRLSGATQEGMMCGGDVWPGVRICATRFHSAAISCTLATNSELHLSYISIFISLRRIVVGYSGINW